MFYLLVFPHVTKVLFQDTKGIIPQYFPILQIVIYMYVYNHSKIHI